jgi:hypothetical protein
LRPRALISSLSQSPGSGASDPLTGGNDRNDSLRGDLHALTSSPGDDMVERITLVEDAPLTRCLISFQKVYRGIRIKHSRLRKESPWQPELSADRQRKTD